MPLNSSTRRGRRRNVRRRGRRSAIRGRWRRRRGTTSVLLNQRVKVARQSRWCPQASRAGSTHSRGSWGSAHARCSITGVARIRGVGRRLLRCGLLPWSSSRTATTVVVIATIVIIRALVVVMAAITAITTTSPRSSTTATTAVAAITIVTLIVVASTPRSSCAGCAALPRLGLSAAVVIGTRTSLDARRRTRAAAEFLHELLVDVSNLESCKQIAGIKDLPRTRGRQHHRHQSGRPGDQEDRHYASWHPAVCRDNLWPCDQRYRRLGK